MKIRGIKSFPSSSEPDVMLRHRLPTRLRLGIPALRDRPGPPTPGTLPEQGLVQAVEVAVGALKGVTATSANPLTGSLLIEHDGAPGREAAIVSALYTIVPPATPEASRLFNDLRRFGATLDRATLNASGGWIDFKTTLPVLLGVYGLTRLLTERPLRAPSSLTLLWWAYAGLRELARNETQNARSVTR